MSLDVMNSTQGAYQSAKQAQSVQTAESASVAHQNAAEILQHSQAADRSISSSRDMQQDRENGGQPSDKELKSAIEMANRRAHFRQTNAQFAYHEDSKRISIKIIDNETNEVIKEIPSEETLEMISRLWDLVGMVVDERR